MSYRRSKVLIIAPSDDLHAKAVQHFVHQENGQAFVLDFSRYPSEIEIVSTTIASMPSHIRWGSHVCTVAELSGLWLRRYRTGYPKNAEAVSIATSGFAARERLAGFEGWVEVAEAAGVRVANHPGQERVAGNKVSLLRTCQHLLIPAPATASTNSPAAAADFVRKLESCGAGVVYKAHTATDTLIPTRRWKLADGDCLEMLRNAPVIFQEYLPGPDLRVTVVGEDVFIAEIRSELPKSECDWRQEVFNETVPVQNDVVARQALAVCRHYGLEYCAMDFRANHNGDFCLIDVNPGGQFLFVEVRTGYPIARSLARLLLANRIVPGPV